MTQIHIKYLFFLCFLASPTFSKPEIKNIVLLELENRSFDHLLGWMYYFYKHNIFY